MASKTHVMVFPMPIQGHINPMLQFSKRLASKGLMVTFVITTSSFSMSSKINAGSVHIETISGDSEEMAKADSATAYMEHFNAVLSRNLSQLIKDKKKESYESPPKVLVYDSVMPWALGLAKEQGLLAATFFTQACSVCAIYYHMYQGNMTIPIQEGDSIVSLPALPLLEPDDLPLFIFNGNAHPGLLSFVVNQFSNFREADWLLFNTFDKLEGEVVKWMKSQWPLKTVGPTIPSILSSKKLILDSELDEKDYGFSLFKPNTESYTKWLATKPEASVIYISFGSLASLGEEQMEELGRGLKNTGHYFLWVVRSSEERKLPSNFRDETSAKGMIVNWCCQVEVLNDPAVGCFMTHCGWNSTLEGLCLGVPMVAMPQWSDQTTNAKYIADVWDAGVRLKATADSGIISGEEIEVCIRQVMEGESGDEFRRNAVRWKELAFEAIDEGGSSDHNLHDFVSQVFCA